MKYKALGLLVAIGILSGRAYPHDSFAATYIVDQTATVDGTMDGGVPISKSALIREDRSDRRQGSGADMGP